MNPISMFIIGGILGILCKYMDIYTDLLGRVFSEMPIWILIGTLIAIFSKNEKFAMFNIFPFCISMLTTYYITAHFIQSGYSIQLAREWMKFACLCPLFAYLTWTTKKDGLLPNMIRAGIVGTSVFFSLFFGTLTFYDFIITGLLVYFLYFHKGEEKRNTKEEKEKD